MLTPDDYAQLALAMTVFSFGQVAVFGGVNQAITRLYSLASSRGELAAYRHCLRKRYAHACAVWGAAVCALAAGLGASGRPEWAGLLLAVLPYSVLNGRLSALMALGNGARARRVVTLHQVADAALKIGLVCLVAHLAVVSVALLFVAYGVATALVLVSMAFWLGPVQPASATAPKGDEIDAIFGRFSGPIFLWSPFVWGVLVADRWALQAFEGAYVVGLYAVAAQMTLGPVRIGMSAVLRYLAPRLFDGLQAGDRAAGKAVGQAMALVLVLTGLGWTVAFLFHASIFRILVAPEYAAASVFLPWLVLAAGLSAAVELVTLNVLGAMNTAALVRPRVATASLGIVLVYFGAWQFGVAGVIAAQIAHSGLFLAWTFFRIANQGRCRT